MPCPADKERSMVEIILSSYNGEQYISELIDSVLASSYTDFRLNVFDDCSSDSTCEIVSSYQDRFPDKVRLFKNPENRGSTLSFLSGLATVAEQGGDYFMFCDQDDVWLRDKIAITLKTMQKLEKKNGVAVPLLVFTDALLTDEKLNYSRASFYKTNHLDVHKTDFAHSLMENKCIGCTMMLNRPLALLIEDVGSDIRYHDWWTLLTASAFGYVRFLNVPTILYRQHGSNQVGQSGFGEYVKARLGARDDVRKRLELTYEQARFFETVFGDRLSEKKKKKLKEFNSLKDYRLWKRRRTLIRCGFLKSGFVRNIGLLLFI